MKLQNVFKAAALAALVAACLGCVPKAEAATMVLANRQGVQGVFNSTGQWTNITSPWSDPKRLDEFLYECTFHQFDYAKGYAFMKKNYAPAGACSAVRNGNFLGHNYDGQYDWVREVIVHTPAEQGRHATVGVAASINLVPDNPMIIPVNGYFKYAPFCVLDGINDAGLAACLNLVEADHGHTTGTNPGKEELNVYMSVRYVLDYAGSVAEALQLLENKNMYSGANMELHLLLADATETAIVEFVDNKMVVKKGATIMTNFFNTQESLNAHAKGVERYNILKENYAESSTKAGMKQLLDRVRYSNLYNRSNANPWYSEFASAQKDISLNSPKEQLQSLLEEHTKIYENRQRTYDCWTTKHRAVYDLTNKTLNIVTQEGNNEFEVKVEQENYIPGMDQQVVPVTAK